MLGQMFLVLFIVPYASSLRCTNKYNIENVNLILYRKMSDKKTKVDSLINET